MVWYVNFLAAVSFASNFATFIYTRKTFNIKQSIYYVLTLDSALAFTSNLSTLIVLFMKTMLTDHLEIPCYILLLAFILSFLAFPFLNFMTAYIRFKTTLSALTRKPWISNAKQIKIINLVVMACYIYLTLFILIQPIGGLKMFPLYAFCMDEPFPTYHSVFFIFCVAPQFIILIITLTLDLKTTSIIQQIRAEQTETFVKRTLLEETPMRASIINGCYIFALTLTAIVFHLIVDRQVLQSSFSLVVVILLIVQTFKSPVIVMWTFRVYQENRNIERKVDREERRQLEINEAKKRQLQLALQRFNNKNPMEGTYIYFDYN